MIEELLQSLLIVIFISIIALPRAYFYENILFLTIYKLLKWVYIIGQLIEPIVDAAKIDAKSKALSGAIFLSTGAPRIGQYILSQNLGVDKFRRAFNRRVGDDMAEFRFELRKKVMKHSDDLNDVDSKRELLSDIKRTRKQIRRRHSIGEVIIAVGIAFISLIISLKSWKLGVGTYIALFSLIFPLSMALRTIFVDRLAYSADLIDVHNEDPRYVPQIRLLWFMKSWNQMLLNNESIIHRLIMVSFIRGEFVLGYELGNRLIDEVLQGEKDFDEAIDDLITESFGEDTVESRWTRRLIKRLFGI